MRCRLPVPALVALALAGCAPTFDDRHDLLGFRIAAIGAIDGEARAALWSGALFHTEAASLSWSADGVDLGEGWGVGVPDDALELGLVATAPDGTVREAVVSVADAPARPAVSRLAVDIAADVSLAARAALDGTPAERSVAETQATRLVVAPDDVREQRWMVAGGEGTLLELDAGTVDVLNEEIRFDDGEVEARRRLDPGVRHVLLLSLDGAGANRWRWVDAAFGVDDPLVDHRGWLLPLDVDTGTGLVAVTAIGVDATGVAAWDEPVGVLDLSIYDPPDCAVPGVPFELDWLVEGRCLAGDVEGRRLVLEVR